LYNKIVKNSTKSRGRKPRQEAVPVDVIRRLSLYLRNLRALREAGRDRVSSEEVAGPFNLSPAQFRKDLSWFGRFGKSGVGYEAEALSEEIMRIIGTDQSWNVAVVGVGEMGGALLKYPGFDQSNFNLAAAFDNNPAKIGRTVNGVKIVDIADAPLTIKNCGIKVAILTVNRDAAQAAAELMVKCGVRAILNFAPCRLILPETICVSNMDVSCELETLVCRLRHRLLRKGMQ